MPDTIFVPIDFSAFTDQQLRLAKNWAIWLDAELRVVHQMEDPIPSLASNAIRHQIHYENKRVISQEWFKLQSEIFGENGKVSFEPISQNLIKYLEEKTQNSSESLIIMGLKGTGKLEQIFLGSRVTEVVERLDQIVIAVPKTKTEIIPKKLMIGANPKYPFNIEQLNSFLDKIEGLVEEIMLINFAEENDNLLDLENYLNEIKSKIKSHAQISTRIYTGDKFKNEAFDEFEAAENCYLILQKGGRTFKDKIFRKFMINELVYRASIPLIIIP
ncbi:universal stress protein [Aquiflexum sp.]|uniref:universal stress protein n=1 Tax=Aquiflexum sp. TaxID=1872584 RepID=UPI003593592F